MPFLASPIRRELLLAERLALGRALDLDDAARAGHDEIGVGAGRGILEIVEVDDRLAVEDAAGDRRDMVASAPSRPDHLPRLHPGRQSCSAIQPPVIEAVRVPPSAWMTSQSTVICCSPSACRSTTARSERPISRWISSVRPPCLPAAASRRMRSPVGARQHAVFGRDPALAAIAHPARHLFLEARRAQHMGVAELHQAGAFGVLGDAALEGDRAHFVGLAFRRAHSGGSFWLEIRGGL